MRKAGLIGLILAMMLLPWQMAWAGPTARGLLALLPPERALDDPLTRGEFAVMLAEAAQIKSDSRTTDLPIDVEAASWYAGSLQALWEQGIICGYHDRTLRPEQGITSLEAVILTARAMGLPNEISGPGADYIVGDIPYGFSQYAFFQRQGFLPPGDALALMRPEAAATWLAELFSSEEQAEELLTQSRKALAGKQALGVRGDTSIRFYSRPGLPATAELDQLTIKGKVLNEYVIPGQMRQVLELELEGPRSLKLEQIVDNGTLYRRVTDSDSDIGRWQKLSLAPDVSQLIKQQQDLGLPANIFPNLQCHYLGESTIDGQESLAISFYARLNKAGSLEELLPPEVPVDGLDEYLELPGKPVRSISYWGIVYLDRDNYLPLKSDYNLVIAFNNTYLDQPAAMTAIEIRYITDKYDFDSIEIKPPPLTPVW